MLHVDCTLYNGCSYQHTKYHKQTKNQWARDDPAFIVICSLLLVVAALAYCAAYDHSAGHAVFVVISILFFHFLISGAGLATFCWLYAFDVHCNSFFPMFVMLYVIHYFLSPLLVAHGFMPALLSNLLFMVAASYYHYLNFLGYDGELIFHRHLPILDLSLSRTVLTWSEWSPRWKPSLLICQGSNLLSKKIIVAYALRALNQGIILDEVLTPRLCSFLFNHWVLITCFCTAVLPFLERTTFFLYPIGVVIVLSPILVLSGFNPSRYFMNVYFSQRVY
ncbi:hypothetical protein DKX38_014268 [Salix brachista]|uniref:Uncharacterized protein n=1 Tax=Salix brachista TaxID=2182728 RepID=A0A5N5LET0_9ROSI|nr:hypothetical protein DKX38_014268 [Salix brachista]